MPSASAPSLGSGGTCRKRSRVVAVMIGTIMRASTMPAGEQPLARADGVAEVAQHGHVGHVVGDDRVDVLASHGPRVRIPQRPMTTLGMPARTSMAKPSGREIHRGRRSVRAKAAPMEMRQGDDHGDDRGLQGARR